MSAVAFLDFNDAPLQEARAAKSFERDELRQRLLAQLEPALQMLFPNGQRRGHEFVIGNLSGDPGDSLRIELEGDRAGLWIDHATGECGDIFSLWAILRGFALPTAFHDMLADIACWLALPKTRQTSPRIQPTLDALGAPAAKWDYLSADGQLLACVYRYDTPKGKQYRPRDVLARADRMPSPRPLYHLPEIARADTVILVEGEKCADALQAQGITATTAMGGASAPLDKTDWSPLAGKTVIVWPDHDQAGQRYADMVIPKLQSIGVRAVRRVPIPSDKPAKWDAADAVAEELDVKTLIAAAQPIATPPSRRIVDWRAIDRFAGTAKRRQWLVEGIFPLAQPSLIAASGGVGKSFLLLALAREVAAHSGNYFDSPDVFGGALASGGVAVYLTAEDDAIEVHVRLQSLGTIPERLYVIPLPDAGGALPLFAPEPMTKAPSATVSWSELEDQLRNMPEIRLIILDPLQPLCALDLNVPENAQFVCSRLAALAASTGASVIVSHHFAKREATTPEQAREAIRGTGGLVDGVRSVYALWHPKEDQAKEICKTLELSYQRGSVVMGGVVKANGKANLKVTTYLRDARGLLVDRSASLSTQKPDERQLLSQLRDAIAYAAVEGKPYTKTGGNGVYERRHALPEVFHSIGKHKLVAWVDALLAEGELVVAMAKGSKILKWLDVPEGPVGQGDADFVLGHLERAQNEAPGEG